MHPALLYPATRQRTTGGTSEAQGRTPVRPRPGWFSLPIVRLAVVGLGLAAALLALGTTASAHDRKSVGALHLTIGWEDEPAYSGLRNGIGVDVTDAAGAPVTDPAAALSVEVSFGADRVTLRLRPASRQPGKFVASLVPTRPGTYAFRITGTVHGQAIDMASTCSSATFACVTDVAAVQFPAKDPSVGQLAERLDRALPRAEGAMASASTARTLAAAALVGAVLALGVAAAGGRRGRKGA